MKITPKNKDILKMMEISGSKESTDFMLKSMLTASLGDIKEECANEIIDLYLTDESYLNMNLKIAEMYGEYYTHAEIKQIIKFYSSPVGKKMTKLTGELAVKLNEVGININAETTARLTPKIVSILEKHHALI